METFLIATILTLITGLILAYITTIIFGFIYFFINKKININPKSLYVIHLISIVVLFLFYLVNNYSSSNELKNLCCGDSGTLFSEENIIGIYTLIILYKLVFIFTIFYKKILPPLLELVINVFLVIGIILNVILLYHIPIVNFFIVVHICLICPIILFLILKLIERQETLHTYILENKIESNSLLGKLCLTILSFKPIKQTPILLVLSIPILIILTSILVIIGQKPNTLVRAFTDTYKNGFSQLTYDCSNIECGDHFLCSVGALGHYSIVKPVRYGDRKGKKIICTRQLLVSNAFEELIQEKTPKLHQLIRKNYNKVGNLIHQYYNIFEIKLISDIVYLLMKPLEWIFLITLYLFDHKPENRISKQYLSKKHRHTLSDFENIT